MPLAPFGLVAPGTFDAATEIPDAGDKLILTDGSAREWELIRLATNGDAAGLLARENLNASVSGFTMGEVVADTFNVRRLSQVINVASVSGGSFPYTTTLTLDLDNEDLVMLAQAITLSGALSLAPPTLDFGSGPVAPDETIYSRAPERRRQVYAYRWNARTCTTANFSITRVEASGAYHMIHARFFAGTDFDTVAQIIGAGSPGANITGGVAGSLNVLDGDYLAAIVGGTEYDDTGVSWTGLTAVETAIPATNNWYSFAEEPDVGATASPRTITFAMTADTDVRYEGVVLRFTPAA